MRKLFSATSYFIIGYTLVVAAVTMLSFLPSSLKASIGMIVAAITFVDLSYRYYQKMYPNSEVVKLKTVLILMAYWALLSISLDVLLMVIILPLIATGNINLLFFNTQPSIYWLQFPMFFIFGFVSQAIYNRVLVITTAKID